MPDALLGVGYRNKDTEAAALRARFPRLFTALDAWPHHALSPQGRANTCARFGLTDAALTECLRAYVAPNAPTLAEAAAADLAALLNAIGAAVAPPKRRATTARKGTGYEGGSRHE